MALSSLSKPHIAVGQKEADRQLEQEAQSVVSICKKDDVWNSCYPRMFATLSKQYDLSTSEALLKKIISEDGRINDCHVIAHQIMSEEVQKHPDQWKELLAVADPNMCNYGFIHGVIEGHALSDPGFKLDKTSIPAICKTMQEEKKIPGIEQGCAHILGHLVLLQTKGDMDQAYSFCSQVPSLLQTQCAAGITMESYTRANLVEHGFAKYVPWTDTFIASEEDICRKLTGNLAIGCWDEMAHLYTYRSPYKKDSVMNDCKTAPTLATQEACYIYAVATLSQSPTADHAYYATLCDGFDDLSYTGQCVFSAVKGLLNGGATPSPSAITYCEALSNEKNECFYDINTLLSMRNFSDEDFRNFCSNATGDDQQRCLGTL